MYTTLNRRLTQHLQTLEHNFMCLDLSIANWNDIQMRQLDSLRRSIDCLRFVIEGFAYSHAPLPSLIQDEVCSQIITIADIAQLLLHRCDDSMSQETAAHMQKFIVTLKGVHDDINAYTDNTSASASA
jgi:hypothetical protein